MSRVGVFMVDVEISGLLEEKLRRLVELGIYSSLSEAVRDAIRRLLDQIDLRYIALKLYVSSDASFQYISEFSETTFDEMIEYMIGHGYTPLIGVERISDLTILKKERKYVLDPLTLYIIYKTGMHKYLEELVNEGYTFLMPDSVKSWVEVITARRLFHVLGLKGVIEFFSIGSLKTNVGKAKLTKHEIYAIHYASKCRECIMLTDDMRTRSFARSNNVEAYSSLSILYTLKDTIDDLEDVLISLKSFPVVIPSSIVGVLGIV